MLLKGLPVEPETEDRRVIADSKPKVSNKTLALA
jgi:hypothetical protein